jgi:hypothetical protein
VTCLTSYGLVREHGLLTELVPGWLGDPLPQNVCGAPEPETHFMGHEQRIDAIPRVATWQQGPQDVLVDTAISHLEKLRRVVMLEEWIRKAANDPLLTGTCREWHKERKQLIDELHLESEGDSDSGPPATDRRRSNNIL